MHMSKDADGRSDCTRKRPVGLTSSLHLQACVPLLQLPPSIHALAHIECVQRHQLLAVPRPLDSQLHIPSPKECNPRVDGRLRRSTLGVLDAC
jgi:hypothetical protein